PDTGGRGQTFQTSEPRKLPRKQVLTDTGRRRWNTPAHLDTLGVTGSSPVAPTLKEPLTAVARCSFLLSGMPLTASGSARPTLSNSPVALSAVVSVCPGLYRVGANFGANFPAAPSVPVARAAFDSAPSPPSGRGGSTSRAPRTSSNRGSV